jgi:hypothetical protein
MTISVSAERTSIIDFYNSRRTLECGSSFPFYGGMRMYVLLSVGGYQFPPPLPIRYGILLSERNEEPMGSLTLIQKQKNGFGDMIYSIQDQSGIVSNVLEENVAEFLKKKGATFLKEGSPYEYARKTDK